MSASVSTRSIRSRLGVGGLFVVLVLAASGCKALTGVAGSGAITTESRDVGAFTRVAAGYDINVTIRLGAAAPIDVTAHANLLPLVATKVDGDTLEITAIQDFTSSQPVDVEIVMPSLDGVGLSGSSRGIATGLDGGTLDVNLSGGTDFTADGSVGTVNLAMSGGAQANLGELASRIVNLELSGGATATVSASEQVSGSASGGARATVRGDARWSVTTSGGAQVTSDATGASDTSRQGGPAHSPDA